MCAISHKGHEQLQNFLTSGWGWGTLELIPHRHQSKKTFHTCINQITRNYSIKAKQISCILQQ